jgi:hypothetical protein
VSALLGGCDPAIVRSSLEISVGIFFSTVINPSPLVGEAPFLFQFPQTVSVGSKKPPPFPVVPCANIRRGKDSISPGVTPRNEFGNDDMPSTCTDSWAIFEEDKRWGNNVNCSEYLTDKPASCSSDSLACPCCANILAREARCEAIHPSLPGGWIKQPNISFVHPQAWEPSVGGPVAKCSAAIFVPLDGKDWIMSQNEVCK